MPGVAFTGGEGKAMILNGDVYVNGEQELRRGKKIRKGDKITVNGVDKTFIADNE